MTVEEMKAEISLVVDGLPGDVLPEALAQLRGLAAEHAAILTDITGNLEQLLQENGNLLKRLA